MGVVIDKQICVRLLLTVIMGKGKGKGKAQQKKATNSKPTAASGVTTSKNVLFNGNGHEIIENARVNAKGNDVKDEVDEVVEEDNGPENSETNPNESDNGTENAPTVDEATSGATESRPEQNSTPTADPPALPASAEPQQKAADSSEQEARITTLQAMVESLSKEKEEAAKREEAHRVSIASLRQQLDSATEGLTQATAHNKALEEQVAALKAVIAESKVETEVLRAQVAQLTAAADALSTDLQLARANNASAAEDDSIVTCDVPAQQSASVHRKEEEVKDQRPSGASDVDGSASVNVYAAIPEETAADTTAEDSIKEATTEAATEALPEPPSASHVTEEGFANFDDDAADSTGAVPPSAPAANDFAPPVTPITAAAHSSTTTTTAQDDDTSDDWARRRISIGIIAQLLPETSPFAPQQFVKAEAQVASLVRMPLTQFAQSLLKGMESKELCHPTKTKVHATFVDKTFVLSTVDVVATGATTWTRGGKMTSSDDQACSTTTTSSLLYRKMIRLKKSVYYNGNRVVTIDHTTTDHEDSDWTVSDFFADDVPWNDEDAIGLLGAGKKPKQPLILVTQLPRLPTATAVSGGGSEANGSQGDDDDHHPLGDDEDRDVAPGFLDVTYVDYDDFPSALSFPCRLVLPLSSSSSSSATGASLEGAQHGVSSGRAPAPRPGVFKQISQSFSFSFNKSTSQVAAVAPATTTAMDTSGSSHHHQQQQHGTDHVDSVLQRLSCNLATATAVSVHGNDVVNGGGARKKTSTAASSFPLARDMFTLDYYTTADEDTTAAAPDDEEATVLPPTHATRVVARVVPVFAWPGDQKDAFHKTLTQTRMIFDVAEGKYISPEDILRRHNYSLVVHK